MIPQIKKSQVLPYENPQNLYPPECPSTVVTAVNKLKQTEDRLLQIMHSKQKKAFNKSYENQRKNNFFEDVVQFSKKEKERKEKYRSSKKLQLSTLKEKNIKKRQQHHDKVQVFRRTFIQRKRQMSTSIKKERQKNEKLIRQKRNSQLQKNRMRRYQMYNASKQAVSNLHEYRKSKHYLSIVEKDEQKTMINNKIKEKQELIKQLEKQTQDVCYELEQFLEECQISSSSKYSSLLEKMGPNSKGFRIKFVNKNQTINFQ